MSDLISRSVLKQAIEDHFDNLDTYFPSAFIKEVEDAPTVEHLEKTNVPKSEDTVSFKVIDKKTGKEPIFDHNHLFKQKWFKDSNLIWCDIEGWFIGEDGCLILADECGNFVYAPMDRYVPVMERLQGKWINDFSTNHYYANCNKCGYQIDVHENCGYHNFCPNCGADMRI